MPPKKAKSKTTKKNAARSVKTKGQPSPMVELPPDVWGSIASRFSTRDWAKLSRAHPALAKAQPRSIEIDQDRPTHLCDDDDNDAPAEDKLESTASALIWITRHWQRANSIDLDLSLNLEEPYEELVSACKDGGGLQQSQAVKRFDIFIRAGPDYCSDLEEDEEMIVNPWNDMEERAEKGKDLEEVVCWLLGYLPALEVLNLRLGHYPATLPPLGNLKELSLCARHWKAGLQDSLLPLRSLESLKLAAERHSEKSKIPECLLKPLTSLRKLELEYLLPAELQLPPQCRLTLIQHGQFLEKLKFGPEGWDEACLDALDTCAIEWNEAGPQSRLYFVDVNLPFLKQASSATAMALCGLAQYALEPILLNVPGLANVTDLFLQSKLLVATVPGSLPLTCLQVVADELRLTFEDPEATASRLEHLLVVYFKDGQPADKGPWSKYGEPPAANPLEPLEAPLAARGKKLKKADRLMYRNKWRHLPDKEISLADQGLIIQCMKGCLMDSAPDDWKARQQGDSQSEGEASKEGGSQGEASDADEADELKGTVWLHELYEKHSNVMTRFTYDFLGLYMDSE